MDFTETLLSFFKTRCRFLKPHQQVLVACSGGPDSVALVLGLHQNQRELPYRFHLVDVNHQLRGRESVRDQKWVEGFAKRLSWPLTVRQGPVLKIKTGNLEAQARVTRYEAFESVAVKNKAPLVLTAHTLDDQAETVLMNIMRGTGVEGLGAIPIVRPLHEKSKVMLGRPLLSVSKTDLKKVLIRSRVKALEDSSNRDQSFLRNWLRNKAIPLLEKRQPQLKKKLSILAEIADEEQGFWTEVVTEVQSRVLKPFRRGQLLDFRGLLRYSAAVQRRVLRGLWKQNLMSFEGVENLRRWMSGPPTNGRIWQLRKGWVVERIPKSKGLPSAQFFWVHHTPVGQHRKRKKT